MLAKKIAQALHRTLIIVDIQETFSKAQNPHGFEETLLEKIQELANTYAEVYQVFDQNIDTVPSYEFPNQQAAIGKNYGFDLQKEDIPLYFNTEDPESILNLEAGTGVETKDGRYLLRVSGVHEWFLLDWELYNFLKNHAGKQVDMVGGAEGECLEDVYSAAIALGVQAQILSGYTY